ALNDTRKVTRTYLYGEVELYTAPTEVHISVSAFALRRCSSARIIWSNLAIQELSTVSLLRPSISGRQRTRFSILFLNTSRKSRTEQPPPRTKLATRFIASLLSEAEEPAPYLKVALYSVAKRFVGHDAALASQEHLEPVANLFQLTLSHFQLPPSHISWLLGAEWIRYATHHQGVEQQPLPSVGFFIDLLRLGLSRCCRRDILTATRRTGRSLLHLRLLTCRMPTGAGSGAPPASRCDVVAGRLGRRRACRGLEGTRRRDQRFNNNLLESIRAAGAGPDEGEGDAPVGPDADACGCCCWPGPEPVGRRDGEELNTAACFAATMCGAVGGGGDEYLRGLSRMWRRIVLGAWLRCGSAGKWRLQSVEFGRLAAESLKAGRLRVPVHFGGQPEQHGQEPFNQLLSASCGAVGPGQCPVSGAGQQGGQQSSHGRRFGQSQHFEIAEIAAHDLKYFSDSSCMLSKSRSQSHWARASRLSMQPTKTSLRNWAQSSASACASTERCILNTHCNLITRRCWPGDGAAIAAANRGGAVESPNLGRFCAGPKNASMLVTPGSTRDRITLCDDDADCDSCCEAAARGTGDCFCCCCCCSCLLDGSTDCTRKINYRIRDGVLMQKEHLMLGGVHININIVRRNLQADVGERLCTSRQRLRECGLHGAAQPGGLHQPSVGRFGTDHQANVCGYRGIGWRLQRCQTVGAGLANRHADTGIVQRVQAHDLVADLSVRRLMGTLKNRSSAVMVVPWLPGTYFTGAFSLPSNPMHCPTVTGSTVAGGGHENFLLTYNAKTWTAGCLVPAPETACVMLPGRLIGVPGWLGIAPENLTYHGARRRQLLGTPSRALTARYTSRQAYLQRVQLTLSRAATADTERIRECFSRAWQSAGFNVNEAAFGKRKYMEKISSTTPSESRNWSFQLKCRLIHQLYKTGEVCLQDRQKQHLLNRLWAVRLGADDEARQLHDEAFVDRRVTSRVQTETDAGQLLQSVRRRIENLLWKSENNVKNIRIQAEKSYAKYSPQNYSCSDFTAHPYLRAAAILKKKVSPEVGATETAKTTAAPAAPAAPGSVDYCVEEATLELSPDPRLYDVETNRKNSTSHVPPNIYDASNEILNVANWTGSLDDVFIANAQKDSTLKWQYFGTTEGMFKIYPGIQWYVQTRNYTQNDMPIDMFDCRTQYWYLLAATYPQDMVILIDNSGSMKGSSSIMANKTLTEILHTLNVNDFFNVVMFMNMSIKYVSNAFNRTMLQATEMNKNTIMELISNDEKKKESERQFSPQGVSDFRLALVEAFELLRMAKNQSASASAGGVQTIMLITDSAPEDFADLFQKYNPDQQIRLFTFLIGQEATDEETVKAMACRNRGYFVQIATLADVKENVQRYVPVLARTNALLRDYFFVWTGVHQNQIKTQNPEAPPAHMSAVPQEAQTGGFTAFPPLTPTTAAARAAAANASVLPSPISTPQPPGKQQQQLRLKGDIPQHQRKEEDPRVVKKRDLDFIQAQV
uniref:VWFA domain-containing protein n=1 Tax=Macrostomum lignano TaxID=282301 RepID=A0A1I8HSM8_9PLAT